MKVAPGQAGQHTKRFLKEKVMENIKEDSPDPAAKAGSKRGKMLTVVLGFFVICGIAYGIYWGLISRFQESTDDAYVNGNVIQITPQQGGTVVAIAADNTDVVKAGQVLVQLDPADASVALAAADAQLAKTVRQVRNLFATTDQLQSNVAMREADLAKAQEDLARRERLASSGAIAGEELQHARDLQKIAQAALIAARDQAAANRALVDQTTVENHPDVRNAAGKVREAYLAYARTKLPAPVSGLVAKRSVQLGQRVSPGMPLMAVVPLDQLWVDANFKEAQLQHVRIGQAAKLTADFYGSQVEYDGKVVGLDAGTGSAFSLLPAQNASGNWIKVVQRLPVRIAIDREQLRQHPLRIGLSMEVTVTVDRGEGATVAAAPRAAPAYVTPVFDENRDKADSEVARIIRANLGDAGPKKKLSPGN